MLGVLCMVKDEQESIATTIQSTKDYIQHVIIYDTGSTDKTISIIEKVCKENKQTLYLFQGVFTSFPQSRNEALRHADTIKVVKFLLLMDAGDEFHTCFSKKHIENVLQNSSQDYFLINQQWIENNEMTQHTDIRLVRNHKNLVYDLNCPVHECLTDISSPPAVFNLITLYQNRDLFGQKSIQRFKRDIQLLLEAPSNRRNDYYLGQTYMSLGDFENGFKYNKLYIENPSTKYNVDDQSAYTRLLYCSIICKKPKQTILDYFHIAIQHPISCLDNYIYLFKYCIETREPHIALPYIEKVFSLKKPTSQSIFSHQFYDYTRWHLISVLCLMSGQKLHLGYKAIQKIIHFQKPNDVINYKLYQQQQIIKL